MSEPSLLARRPVLTGAGVGIAVLLPHAFLPPDASLGLAAMVMAVTAGVYFGFAVVNGSAREQMIEFSVASLFAMASLLGLLSWPLLLPIANCVHAVWDLLHHNRAPLSLVSIPQWYVPWCVMIDVVVGVGLPVVWRRAGTI